MSKSVIYLKLCLIATLMSPLMLNGQDVPDQTNDEAAVRSAGKEYVTAFNKRDAATLATFWSPASVYVNRITGEQVVGRDAIATQFKSLFDSAPNLKLAVNVESIQFVSPNVAVEHGSASFIAPDAPGEETEYSAVYVRRDGKWLLDRVTDKESRAKSGNYEQLKELEWFIGSWVDQDENIRIVTECNWTKNKNFITRSFTVSAAGNVELSGIQIIGWDAGSQQIRSWTFDSDGGVSQGVWSKSKDRWYVHKKGPRDTLGKQQPPRNDISVPTIDDHIGFLIQQIPFDDTNFVGRTIGTRKHKCRLCASFWLCHRSVIQKRFANRQWNDVLLSTSWAKELRHYFLG